MRRIASGERADVFLAAVVEPAGSGGEAAPETSGDDAAAPRRGLVALRVYDRDADHEAITAEVEAMALVSALPALLDLATLEDGRTCVVVERLAGPTLATLTTERMLTAGEAVTVLAPILLAVHELERHGFAHLRLAMSDVMFDESGRARVIGTGRLCRLETVDDDPGARTRLVREMYAALARLVEEISAVTRPRGALDPVRHLLEELLTVRPFRVRPDELERELFGVAAPTALHATSAVRAAGARRHRALEGGSANARAVVPGARLAVAADASADARADTSADARADARLDDASAERARARRWLPGALASFDALVTQALPAELERDPEAHPRATRLVDRVRALLAERRGVLLVGGLVGAGALVLALTVVPPAAEPAVTGGVSGEAAAGAQEPAAEAGAAPDGGEYHAQGSDGAPATDHAQEAGPGLVVAEDAAVATMELLRRRARCFAELEAGCLEGVVQPGSSLETADRAAMAAAQSGTVRDEQPEFVLEGATITGEMGEAWLVAVPYSEPERPPASILVMRSEAGWRLREIFG